MGHGRITEKEDPILKSLQEYMHFLFLADRERQREELQAREQE